MIADTLPTQVELNAIIRPKFSTEVVTTDGGWEVRNSRWAYPLHEIELSFPASKRDATNFLAVRDLYYAAGGSAETFLFKAWNDYSATAQDIGTGDGADTTFQLVKNYTRGATNRARKITRPISGTVSIYLDGVLQTVTTHYAIDHATGIVTFVVAPTAAVAITATFEFKIPVRFVDDAIEFTALTPTIEHIDGITLTEVKE